MDRSIQVRRQPPKIEQPGHARSRFPRGTFAPAKLRRRGMREVTGGRFGLLPGTARGAGGGFTPRASLSGLGRTEGLGGTPGLVPGLGRQTGLGSCPPGLPTQGPNFTGAGVTIDFLRGNIARSADLRHRVLEGFVRVPVDGGGQPIPGRRVIPLNHVRANNPGRFVVPFGMVFLLVDFETFACDAAGEIPGCVIPNVVFNLSRGLNSTVFLNGRPVNGMLAGQHLDHAFEGLGVKVEPDLTATYEIIGSGCTRTPTIVGVQVKGYLLSRELYSEAFDVICPSGPRGSCT